MPGLSEGVICFVDVLHNLSDWQSAAQASTDCWSPEGWLRPRQACRPHTAQSETRCHTKSDVQSVSASPGHHRPYPTLAFALSNRHSSDRPTVPPDAVLSVDLQNVCSSSAGQPVWSSSQALSAKELPLTAVDRAIASSTDSSAATMSQQDHGHTACRQLFPPCQSPRTCTIGNLGSETADVIAHADSSPVSSSASCSTCQLHEMPSAYKPEATDCCAKEILVTAAPPVQQSRTVMQPAQSADRTSDQQQQHVCWTVADMSSSDWGEGSAVQPAAGALETGVAADPSQQQQHSGRPWVPAIMSSSYKAEGSGIYPTPGAVETGVAASPGQQQQQQHHISQSSMTAPVPSTHQLAASVLQQAPTVVAKPATEKQHQASSSQRADHLGLQLGVWPGVVQQSQLPPSAAAMAAWLLQQPKLLESVLDQLEVVAATQGKPVATPTAQVYEAAHQSQAQPQYPAAAMQQSAHEKQQDPIADTPVCLLDSTVSGVIAAAGVVTDAEHPSSSFQDDAAVMENIEEQPCSNANMNKLQQYGGHTGGADAGSIATSSQPVQQRVMGDDLGQQLLEHSQAGRYDEARQLIKQGASLSSTDQQGNTALMLACQRGYGRVVKLLVRKGANIQAQNSQGLTAVGLAQASMHNNIVKFLTAATDDQAAA